MKRLIIWGNCQTAGMWEVFRRLPSVAGRWVVCHHELYATGERREANLAEFDDCDLLLVQNLRDWKDHPRAASLPDGVRVERFPFCYFAALWPFDGHQNGPDPGWYFGEGERKFGFQDHLLGRLRVIEPDPERRYARYRALDVEDPPDLARYAAFEEARLLREDQRLGYTVGRFIVDNYRTRRLFHAITHPTPVLLLTLVREVLAKLGLDDAGAEEHTLDFFRYFQVPLHPLVVRQLAIQWADDGTRYNFNNAEDLTFEEYVRRYIRVYG